MYVRTYVYRYVCVCLLFSLSNYIFTRCPGSVWDYNRSLAAERNQVYLYGLDQLPA